MPRSTCFLVMPRNIFRIKVFKTDYVYEQVLSVVQAKRSPQPSWCTWHTTQSGLSMPRSMFSCFTKKTYLGSRYVEKTMFWIGILCHAGEKFSATKWVHVAHYAVGFEHAKKAKHLVFVPPPPPAPEGCVDALPHECGEWANSGECTANPGFMVGSQRQPGQCLLSCSRCDLMRFVRSPPPSRWV